MSVINEVGNNLSLKFINCFHKKSHGLPDGVLPNFLKTNKIELFENKTSRRSSSE